MEAVMQPKTIYEGKIRITDVRAVPGDSAFLIDDGTTAVLCDSGFAFTGRAVADNLRQVLGKRTLDYILLTHSHYDHVMARTITPMHLDGKTNSEIYEFLERRDYKDHVRSVYPQDAFRMNMELMIKLVIKETDNGR